MQRNQARLNPPLSFYPMLDPPSILQYHLFWAPSFLKTRSLFIILQQLSLLCPLHPFTSPFWLSPLASWTPLSLIPVLDMLSRGVTVLYLYLLFVRASVCDQSLEVEADRRCSRSHIQISFHTAEGEKTWHSTLWGGGGRGREADRVQVVKEETWQTTGKQWWKSGEAFCGEGE